MSESSSTHQLILDTATELMQLRGYHAFSYADIAERVGIRKASIHYHFPAKSDLARSIVAQYRATARVGMAQLQALNPLQQLEAYVDLYAREFGGGPRMCLCALLAAELPSLPEDVRAEVQGYYEEQEHWLSAMLAAGCRAGLLQVAGSVEVAAQVILAGLEGAMLAARVYGDVMRIQMIAEGLVRQYRVDSTAAEHYG